MRRVSYEKRQVKEEQASKSLTSITSASTVINSLGPSDAYMRQ